MQHQNRLPARFRPHPLAKAVSLATAPVLLMPATSVVAQDEESVIEEVIVTASRRQESVQDIPINITAVSDTMIEDLRLDGIAEIARYVPGLTVVDRGPRDEVPDILVRGLNTTGLGPGFESDTVAVYLGEVPLQIDLKPIDLERVEVGQAALLGLLELVTVQCAGDRCLLAAAAACPDSGIVGHSSGWTPAAGRPEQVAEGCASSAAVAVAGS